MAHYASALPPEPPVIPSPYAHLPPADRHHCEMRDLLLAGLDLRQIRPDPPPTQNEELKRDIRRACEHLAESRLPVLIELYDARPVWDAAGQEVMARIERGDPAGVRPSAWAVRLFHRDWYEASWPVRGWLLFKRAAEMAAVKLLSPCDEVAMLLIEPRPTAAERRVCQDYWRRHGRRG